MVASNDPRPDPGAPSSDVDAQLVSYAQDLRRLYREHRRLQSDVGEVKEFTELRLKELSALNSLIQRVLVRHFELEDDYESLLDKLDQVAWTIMPNETKDLIQALVWQGRLHLLESRRGESSLGSLSLDKE